MDSTCLRTDGLSAKYRFASTLSVVPEYGCLVLSPANLWGRDPSAFQLDPSPVNTVFNYHKSRQGRVSLADLAFGVRRRATGLTKWPVRNRQRVITFAVTIVMKAHDPAFVAALRSHLEGAYPLHKMSNASPSHHSAAQILKSVFDGEARAVPVHIYYPRRSYFMEFLPFCVTLIALFCYVYFSCSKIELVRSKLGIAFSSVFTVLSSILMSLGLSGLSLDMNSKMCVVPYLVAFISLENILVITRSVTGTPSHLDVKIRVAQGLSREGWNITMNLVTEITILAAGFFIGFVDPLIHEFCLLAVMGLLSDYFLQTFFFPTVLSMDMSQLEMSEMTRTTFRRKEVFHRPVSGPGMKKTGMDRQTSVVAPQCSTVVQEREAKRVRLLNFWAKRRIVQKLFSICMVVWISLFVYQTGLLESAVFKLQLNSEPFLAGGDHIDNRTNAHEGGGGGGRGRFTTTPSVNFSALIVEEDRANGERREPQVLKKLLHPPPATSWTRLPPTHWPMLFGLYNFSLSGGYVTILPPIQLATTVSTEAAVQLRHPEEERKSREERVETSAAGGVAEGGSIFEGFFASIVDSSNKGGGGDGGGDDDDADVIFSSDSLPTEDELSRFVPTSPSELFLGVVFAFPSIIFLVNLVSDTKQFAF